MSGYISRFSIASILLSSLTLFACSSDDDGGGATATVPPNAITITEANAKEIVQQATVGGVGLIDAIQAPLAIEAGQAPSASEIIDLVLDKVKSISNSPQLDIPVAEVFEFPCDSGTITVNATETATSANGTMTFNDCILSGVTLSGTIAFSASFNDSTGDWSLSMNGNISATNSVSTTTLSGLVLNQTGNDNTLEYSINTYTFALDYTGGGGFLVQLLAAIVGNEAVTCPRSGVILVTGADSTRAKGTINGDGTVTIEYDDGSGTFVEVPGSPFPCAEFFT